MMFTNNAQEEVVDFNTILVLDRPNYTAIVLFPGHRESDWRRHFRLILNGVYMLLELGIRALHLAVSILSLFLLALLVMDALGRV